MPRTIWLAFVCLLCLGALFALRASTGARRIEGRTDAAPAPAMGETGLLLEKSDRLPPPPLNGAEAPASVITLKIAPEPAEKASPRTVEPYRAAGEREE